MKESGKTATVTMEEIVDSIRCARNAAIKHLMVPDNLMDRWRHEFMCEVSKEKMEVLMRELSEQLISPVDLKHYSLLIQKAKETNSLTLGPDSETYVNNELKSIYAKYAY